MSARGGELFCALGSWEAGADVLELKTWLNALSKEADVAAEGSPMLEAGNCAKNLRAALLPDCCRCEAD